VQVRNRAREKIDCNIKHDKPKQPKLPWSWPDSATVRFELPDHLFGTASPPIFATLISL